MQVVALYALVVLIWGSTWAAIPYQLGTVAPEVSIAYRFALASVALFGYAAIAGGRLRIPLNIYPMVLAQGLLLFSINYFFVYYGTAYITSGLVAVVFSLIVIFNAVFERLFFRTPLESRLVLASLFGLAGIVLVFWREVSDFSFDDQVIVGITLVAIGTISASLGNMTALANMRRNLPVIALNAHAMAWGSLVSILVALAIGRPINFSSELSFMLSLFYLAIFGSAIAFGSYLALIKKIGAARAAHTSVLFPVVALLISTVLEGYRWTGPAVVGVLMIMTGNWLALRRVRQRM